MPTWRSRRGVVEVDVNFVLSDDDLLGDGFDDVPLLIRREPGPALVEVPRARDDFFFGQVPDLHHIKLGLGSREPDIAPALVLGSGHVGSARLGAKPVVPNDRILLEC